MEPLTAEQRAMVEANTGLIGWVLNRYYRHLKGDQDANADAWQDGVFGLARAAQLYDPSTGNRFSTYATGWIRASIQRGHLIDVNMRRALDKGTEYEAPVSLDMELTESGTVSLEDSLASADDPAAEVVAESIAEGLRRSLLPHCDDDLDRDLVEWLLDPDDERPVVAIGLAHGMARQTPFNRLRRLRQIARTYLQDAS